MNRDKIKKTWQISLIILVCGLSCSCNQQQTKSEELIAFLKYEPMGYGQIYILDPDTGIEQKIVSPFEGFSCPVWSPDGENLLLIVTTYLMNHGQNHDGEVYLFNIESNQFTKIPVDEEYSLWAPTWSPDGRLIMFSGYWTLDEYEMKPFSNLFVYDLESGNLSSVTSGEEVDWRDPRWSPIEDQVLAILSYNENGVENNQLVLINLENGSRDTLVESGGFLYGPTVVFKPRWSPDGRLFAYSERRINGIEVCGDIFTMELASAHKSKITKCQPMERNEYPDWSPDGEKIIFISNRDHLDEYAGNMKFDIYRMNNDGTNIERLTTSGDVYCPSIQP